MTDPMLKQLRLLAAALAVVVPSVVCAQQPASPSGPADAAARVGDRVITVKELDDAWRQADAAEQTRAVQALYDGRMQALDRLIADMLIEQAAKARGVPAEQFAREETAKRIKSVSDAEIAAFHAQNQSRMQGKSLDDMRAPIRGFLEQQQQAAARQALVAELRKAGPPVRIVLDPPRQKVEIASTDPTRGGANAAVVLIEFSDYQ